MGTQMLERGRYPEWCVINCEVWGSNGAASGPAQYLSFPHIDFQTKFSVELGDL